MGRGQFSSLSGDYPSPLFAMSQPKAYSYLRFSTPEQALGDSKRRQVDMARAWAVENGLTLDEELADEGVSGFRGANTRDDTALGSFLRAVQAGDVPKGSVLIVESLDRITRDRILEAQAIISNLLLSDIRIVTLTDRKEYSRQSVSENPINLLLSLLVLMRANEESETKASRLRASWERKRELAKAEGKRMTSRGPAWMEPSVDGQGFDLIPERAEIVRRIFQDTLEGKGQERIALELTQEGVPTWSSGRRAEKRTDNTWHRTYVKKILEHPACVGDIELHVTERQSGGRTLRRTTGAVVQDYYPAAIDRDIWDSVRVMVGNRNHAGLAGRGRHAGKPLRHLLANLAKCGICGGTMTRVSKGKGNGTPRLVCAGAKRGSGCVYRSVKIDELETAILEARERILDQCPEQGDAAITLVEQRQTLGFMIDALEDELDDIARQEVVLPYHRERRSTIYAQIDGLKADQVSISASLAGFQSRLLDQRVAELSDALDLVAANAGPEWDYRAANSAMRKLFSAVVVNPSGGEVVFHWRHGGDTAILFGEVFQPVEGEAAS